MEIELYDRMTANNPIAAIESMGKWFAASGMFGCEREEQGRILALSCMLEKKSPIEIKRIYHLMNGELSMRADAMAAELRKRGGKIKEVSRTSELAKIDITFEGETTTYSFSFAEAKQEPFVWGKPNEKTGERPLKKNWATPYARMQVLWARVVSNGVRARCPEIVAGAYTPEEISDFDGGTGSTAAEIRLAAAPERTIKARAAAAAADSAALASTTTVTAGRVEPAKEVKLEVMPTAGQSPKLETTANETEKSEEAKAGLGPTSDIRKDPEVQKSPEAVRETVSAMPKALPTPAPDPVKAEKVETATNAELIEFQRIVGPYEDKAFAWMKRNNWIAEGHGVAQVARKNIQRVIKQSDTWLRAIGAGP